MRYLILLLSTTICLNTAAQSKLDKKTEPIVEEGKLLYRLEMASWFGTDIFMATYNDRNNIGGYFSYVLGTDSARCIFYSKGDNPVVIGTITFDNSYDLDNASKNFDERPFTTQELDLYTIRDMAINIARTDELFRIYPNTNFNLIPLIHKNEKKVYILTGPTTTGVVIFGNDYLIRFNKNNKVIEKKSLHKNIIPIKYGGDTQVVAAAHTHLPETGDFITATDICTTMLYSKITGWDHHYVTSKDYTSIWYCKTNKLLVLTNKALNRINDHQQKMKADNEKK